jgi:hypothetical protein
VYTSTRKAIIARSSKKRGNVVTSTSSFRKALDRDVAS